MISDCVGCMTAKAQCFCEPPNAKLEYPGDVLTDAHQVLSRIDALTSDASGVCKHCGKDNRGVIPCCHGHNHDH
jgi:hypothetical protein